ncbi:uncharacterized protein LOC122511806 [Leptopilina heterotoma]|uniref:uncharacterized protein LOC122511806 n=1 Tax=Leptopilina heterotoma TaxID=63436 RepID=UPI001CA9B5B7|nr:uncharacterized protein LOC122511806 [Leptopilina heterotoma]
MRLLWLCSLLLPLLLGGGIGSYFLIFNGSENNVNESSPSPPSLPTTSINPNNPEKTNEDTYAQSKKINFNLETALIVSNITDTTVQLNWIKPRRYYDKIEYRFYIYDQEGYEKSYQFQDFPIQIVQNLQPGTRYKFYITYASDTLKFESEGIVTKTARGKPDPPLDLKVSKMKYVRSMIIEWRRPLGSEIITGYNLHIAKNGSGPVQDTQVFDTSDYPKYIYYFEESSEFDIRVASFNSKGSSSIATKHFRSKPIEDWNAFPTSV